jgi:hypothetical protein
MGKSSFEYPDGVYVYKHRVHEDENGDPVVLVADARVKPILNRETRQPEVDPITGQPRFAPVSLYGLELHRQLSAEPQTWEDITSNAPAPVEHEEPRKSRASIRKRSTAPDPEPTEDPAEQEPAE